ncbi:MAG: hypothetical protein KDD66_04170 [Bdellovibrionales bacterium]|nr:hypothetical protein [Bdellovibrionales bacterium]
MKQLLVEEAQTEIAKAGKRATIARINVMTGVHRKDVARLLDPERTEERPTSNVSMQVMGQWEQSEQFTTQDGKPRVLSISKENNEFAKLVSTVNSTLKPGTILFELERLGAVERTPRGVRLVSDYQSYSKDSSRAHDLLARNIETLATCSQENIESPGEAVNLHIRTEYDNVFKEDVPKIRKWLLERGKKLHREARDFISKFDKDVHEVPGKAAGTRVVLTAFSWIDEPETDSDQ